MEEFFTGTVKWFNNGKGFGFIIHPTGEDVFVHYSVIQTEGFKTLKEGDLVTYQITNSGKGLSAKNVTIPETTIAANN